MDIDDYIAMLPNEYTFRGKETTQQAGAIQLLVVCTEVRA
jgi:hypothetical protein